MPIDIILEGIIVFWHPLIKELSEVFIIALQLSRESYMGFSGSTFIDVKPLQLSKTLLPIEVTLEGIYNDFIPTQPLKA